MSDIEVKVREVPSRRSFAVFLAALAVLSILMGFRIDDRTSRLDEGKRKYLVEDAGISVVFAKMIAKGEGVVYYPDGEIVEGYSNPLWTFLMAGLTKAGIDPFEIPRPMGLIFTVVGLFFGGLLVWWCTDDRRSWLGLLVPPVAGEAGTVVIWAIAGLENGLFAATLLAALAFFARERTKPEAFPISGFLFFLVAFTRPEGMVYGGVAGLWVIFTEIVPRRKLTLRQVLFAALFLVPLIGYQAARYAYFAWPFPNTYYAKTSDSNWNDLTNFQSRGWRYIIDYLRVYRYSLALALTPFSIFAARRWRQTGLALLSMLFACFFPIYSRGDWMEEWRFTSVVSLLLIVLALLGAARAASLVWIALKPMLPSSRKEWWKDIATLAASFVIFGLIALPQFGASARRVAKFVRNPIVNTYKLQQRGSYFRDMADRLDLRPGSVLEIDMGGIGEASKMVIYDVGKLCDVPFGVNQWDRVFVNNYVFEETRPDFMHARESFGTGSHIVGNPNLGKMYELLPQDKRLGLERHNGNYVRRDLFVLNEYHAPEGTQRFDFGEGPSLVGGEVYPSIAKPKQVVRIKAVWNAAQKTSDDFNADYELIDSNGKPLVKETRALVMNWYPTSKWDPEEFPVDLVKLKIPANAAEGPYKVRVTVNAETPSIAPVITGWSVIVSADAVDQTMQELFGSAQASLPEFPETAKKTLDRLWYFLKDRKEQKRFDALQKEIAWAFFMKADYRLAEGKEAEAAEAAIEARKLDHLDPSIMAFCQKLADRSYARGRELQLRGGTKALDEAYSHYVEALRRYPRDSWARRRAEETRPAGVIRRGKREMWLP